MISPDGIATLTATPGPVFAAGTAISSTITIGPADPFLLITPEDWEPANLTFAVSADGVTFYPLYINGALWQIACPPGAALLLLTDKWPKGLFIKFLSGTVGNPINQPKQCEFKVIT